MGHGRPLAACADARFAAHNGLKSDMCHVGFVPILLQKSAAADGLSVILFNGDRL
jgi:hypothetical protein